MIEPRAADPAQPSCEARLCSNEAISRDDLVRLEGAISAIVSGKWRYKVLAALSIPFLALRHLPALLEEVWRLRAVTTEAYMAGWHDGRRNGFEIGEEHRRALFDQAVRVESHRLPPPIVVDARLLDLNKGGPKVGR